MNSVVKNIELLISKHKEMIDRLEELKRAVIHEEQRSRFVPGHEVSFTKSRLEKFKITHKKALANGLETFWFEENEYLTEYAKYMIEYLESQSS